jgi:hypothetical protein
MYLPLHQRGAVHRDPCSNLVGFTNGIYHEAYAFRGDNNLHHDLAWGQRST